MAGVDQTGVKLSPGGSVMEVLQYGERVGKAAAPLTVVPCPDAVDAVRLFDPVTRQFADGGVPVHKIEPARGYTARTVTALVDLAVTLAVVAPTKYSIDRLATVHVSRDLVRVWLNETLRRDRVDLPLAVTETWQILAGGSFKIASGEERELGDVLTQRELRTLLKTQLDAEYVPDDIVARITNVKIDTAAASDATIDHGKFALSRSTVAKVSNIEAIPDEITVIAALWDNVLDDKGQPVTYGVRCTLDIDPMSGSFVLRPKAGQIERAEQRAMADLVERLRGDIERHPGRNGPAVAGDPPPANYVRFLVTASE